MPGRLNHTIAQAVELANVSRTTLYEEIKAGRLRVLKVGRKTLITDRALREWLANLEAATQKRKGAQSHEYAAQAAIHIPT